MSETIINKVAESGLVTIDLEEYYPREEIAVFDLKPFLFQELILKEKDFRQQLLQHDWTAYANKVVAVTCSAEVIIPVWAYMLVAVYLQPVASDIVLGNRDEAFQQVFIKNLRSIPIQTLVDKRVVIKGCGEKPISESLYFEVTKLLLPVAKSIMYGEPCSTVPIYKKK